MAGYGCRVDGSAARGWRRLGGALFGFLGRASPPSAGPPYLATTGLLPLPLRAQGAAGAPPAAFPLSSNRRRGFLPAQKALGIYQYLATNRRKGRRPTDGEKPRYLATDPARLHPSTRRCKGRTTRQLTQPLSGVRRRLPYPATLPRGDPPPGSPGARKGGRAIQMASSLHLPSNPFQVGVIWRREISSNPQDEASPPKAYGPSSTLVYPATHPSYSLPEGGA